MNYGAVRGVKGWRPNRLPRIDELYLAHFPEYAATYNIQNQMGMHDTFGLLMNALGTEVELQNNPNKVIAMSKAAGLDFLNF